MTSTSDDSESYKRAMATEWNRAAGGWHAWTPFVREWLRVPTQAMLDRVGIIAGSRGIANLHTRVMDAESLDFEAASFDAAISRLGIMYCPDPTRALSQIRRVLRPGSSVAGPFSLGAPGLLAQTLADAGFADVRVETLSAPARMQSVDDCNRFRAEASGTIKAMMAPLDERTQAEAWEEMRGFRRLRRGRTGLGSSLWSTQLRSRA